jgi:hypothetical protein
MNDARRLLNADVRLVDRRAWSRATLVLLISALAAFAVPARAGTAQECAASYEQAQKLRRAEKLGAAREQLLVCAQPSCPKFMVADCSQWLGEVEQAFSSVVLGARDSLGRDVTNVRVLLDGVPFVDTLDGRAIQIDSGIHRLRFELEHRPAIEQEIIIRQGERNRLVAVQFAPDAKQATTMSASAPGFAEATERTDTRRYVAYGLEGLGAVGIGGFVFLGLSGRADRDRLRNECAPACSQSDVDAAKQKLLIGDISLAVGVASAAVGTWFLLTSSPGTKVQLGIEPTARGGFAEVTGTFE